MAEPTLSDAIGFIGPLVGAGGFTAIVVAWLGTRQPKTPAKPDHPASVGISALLSDSTSINRISEELRRLTDALEEIGRAGNRYVDMMDIMRAVERLRPESASRPAHKEPASADFAEVLRALQRAVLDDAGKAPPPKKD